MVPFEDGSSEVVEVRTTTLAMIPLTSRLGLIAAVSNDLGTATTWAAYTLRPSDGANGVEAFGIVD
jgi:hypothetical protein